MVTVAFKTLPLVRSNRSPFVMSTYTPRSSLLLNRNMIDKSHLSAETYAKIDDLVRIGSVAVANAQEESRRLGVPNVYSINGRIYYFFFCDPEDRKVLRFSGVAAPEVRDVLLKRLALDQYLENADRIYGKDQ